MSVLSVDVNKNKGDKFFRWPSRKTLLVSKAWTAAPADQISHKKGVAEALGLNGSPGRHVGFLMRYFPRWQRGLSRPKAQVAPPPKNPIWWGLFKPLGPAAPQQTCWIFYEILNNIVFFILSSENKCHTSWKFYILHQNKIGLCCKQIRK